MKKHCIILILLTVSFQLFGQDKEYKKLFKEASNLYEDKAYAESDSLFREALTYIRTKEIYLQLMKMDKITGDTCKYCDDLLSASSFKDKTLESEYYSNCSDTIWYNNPKDKYRYYCIKSHFYCKDKPKSFVAIDEKDSILYSFSLVNPDFEDMNGDYSHFPDIFKEINNAVFSFTDIFPEYIGGSEARLDYLSKNLQYPGSLKRHGGQGTVYVSFIIDERGYIRNTKILRGVSPELNNEAIRVINNMSKWRPGRFRGIPVKVKFIMPIRWSLG